MISFSYSIKVEERTKRRVSQHADILEVVVKHAVGIRGGSHFARAARVEGGGRHVQGVAGPVSVRSSHLVFTSGQHLKSPKTKLIYFKKALI